MVIRAYLTALMVLVGAAPHVLAQQAPPTEIERGVIGLPVWSSDGQPIGLVTQAGIGDGEAVLIAEVERPLGLGPDLLAIPTNMYVDKGDHIALTLTADQVRQRLDRRRLER